MSQAISIRVYMEPGGFDPLHPAIGDDLGPLGSPTRLAGRYVADRLPISEELRERLADWSGTYVLVDSGELDHGALDDFDVRGLILSRWLQRELGSKFSVTYEMEYAESTSVIRDILAEPCDGWSVRS